MGVTVSYPYQKRAAEALEHGDRKSEAIFPMTGNAVKLAWRRLKQKHNIAGVRFHDLRHEAISSLFERGLSLPEVALISGHKDPRMLMRYTHLRAEELAKKLD
jgi:integrase